MSELSTAPDKTLDVVAGPEHVIEAVRRPPILITEHELALSTAAAVPLPRTKPTRRVIATFARDVFEFTGGARPARRHYPPRRDAFLEQAAMAREMRRL